MPDYSKIQIYRFVCNDLTIKDNYVGSTTNWTKRKQHHKKCCNNLNNNHSHLNIYKVMRENGGFENWNMILIEDYPCENRRQAEQREQYWKEFYNDNMGQNRAFVTEEQKIQESHEFHKKHYQANKDILAEKYQAKYQANKTKILEQTRAYKQANKDIIKERSRAYRQANKDIIKEQSRAYYQANKDLIL